MGGPGPRALSGAVLDSGALIAFERNERRAAAIIARAVEHDDPLVVPAGVVAQTWRDGGRQVRLARLLRLANLEVLSLDEDAARAAGTLCGIAGTSDVVDASVATTARRRRLPVVTADADDLRRLDPGLDLEPI